MTVEELVLLVDLLDKLGYNTETAGTGTVFQRLTQVADYVDTVEGLIGTASPAAGDLTTLFKGLKLIADYTDTLETKVGLNSDAAGTTTLFARLAQISDSKIGTSADGSGVATLFGKLAAVLADIALIKGYTDQVEGFVDALESNLGTTGDVANASGTVLARLAELLTNRLTAARAGYLDAAISSRAAAADYTAARAARLDYINDYISNRAPASTALSTADYTVARAAKLDNLDMPVSKTIGNVPYSCLFLSAANNVIWNTVLNISGAGVLNRISARVESFPRNGLGVQVVIDGTTYTLWDRYASSDQVYTFGRDTDTGPVDFIFNCKFDTSLQVQTLHGGDTYNRSQRGMIDYTLF